MSKTSLHQLALEIRLKLQNAKKWKEYCDSKLIPTEQCDRPVSKIQSILSLIKNLWQNAITALARESELKIWQKQDCDGYIHWHVYDPLTDKLIFFASELEMLSQIDNFYTRGRW